MDDILENIEAVHEIALVAAKAAADDYFARYGDDNFCFVPRTRSGPSTHVAHAARCTVFDVHYNSRLGMKLKQLGYEKSWAGLQLWNPSKLVTLRESDALSAKQVGSSVYVGMMRDAFPELKIYDGGSQA